MDWPLETSNLLFIGGILLLTFTMVRRIRRRSQAADSQAPSTSAPRTVEQRHVGHEVLEAKLFDTFRELNGRLETKIHVLNVLIEEADRKIEKLEALRSAGDMRS